MVYEYATFNKSHKKFVKINVEKWTKKDQRNSNGIQNQTQTENGDEIFINGSLYYYVQSVKAGKVG